MVHIFDNLKIWLQFLTANKPCVQAWSRMDRREFSTSYCVATFMSVLAEYNVDVQHI